MNQLHSEVQVASAVRVAASEAAVKVVAPRLVVVMREPEEEVVLAGRILELARARSLPVVLVGVARDPAKEATLRRSLVTIAAFIREATAYAGRSLNPGASTGSPEIQIECGRDWMNGLRSLLRRGDVLACYSEDRAGILERPLNDILCSGLNMPVYTFAGLTAPKSPRQNRWTQMASWVASLASIGGFLMLGARIVIAVQGWLQSVLLLVALLVEVAVVWFVNSLIAQI